MVVYPIKRGTASRMYSVAGKLRRRAQRPRIMCVTGVSRYSIWRKDSDDVAVYVFRPADIEAELSQLLNVARFNAVEA